MWNTIVDDRGVIFTMPDPTAALRIAPLAMPSRPSAPGGEHPWNLVEHKNGRQEDTMAEGKSGCVKGKRCFQQGCPSKNGIKLWEKVQHRYSNM